MIKTHSIEKIIFKDPNVLEIFRLFLGKPQILSKRYADSAYPNVDCEARGTKKIKVSNNISKHIPEKSNQTNTPDSRMQSNSQNVNINITKSAPSN